MYPSPELKAAAIIQSLIMNHPFIDGNKRIGYYMARAILLNFQLSIEASEDDKHNFVIAIAEGKLNIEGTSNWFTQHTVNV